MVSFVLDDRAARRTLEWLEQAAVDPRGAYDAIGAYMVFSTQQNIELERTPEGQPWPRLSPRTAAHRIGRRRRGYDNMLRVSSRLYQSISYDVLADGLAWGSNLAYARIHQLGGTVKMPERQGRVTLKSVRRRGGGVRTRFVRAGAKGGDERRVTIRAHEIRVPARAYLGFSDQDRQRVEEIVVEYLNSEAPRG